MADIKIEKMTVIKRGTVTMDGRRVEAEVIYLDEENGLIQPLEGEDKEPRKAHPDQYKQLLETYRKEREVNDVTDIEEEETELDEMRFKTPQYQMDMNLTVPKKENEKKEVPQVRKKQPVAQKNQNRRNKASRTERTGREDHDGESPEEPPRPASKKKIIIPLAVLGVFVLAVVVLVVISKVKTGSSSGQAEKKTTVQAQAETKKEETKASEDSGETLTYKVAVLNHAVSAGDTFTASDISEKSVTKDEFDELSDLMYVGSDGTATEGTPLDPSMAESFEGCICARAMEEGSVVYVNDLRTALTDVSGQTTLKLIAVISDEDGNDVTLELGRYVLDAGALTDILNSRGDSVLEDVVTEDAE